jgi:Neprosin
MNRLIVTALLAALLLPGCARRGTDTSRIASFAEFLQATEKARAADYVGKPGTRVTDRTEFERMKAYLLNRYQGMHVTHSFHGAEKAFVDCVPILEQPGLRKAGAAALERAAPPAIGAPASQDAARHSDEFKQRGIVDLRLKPGIKDELGNERFCHGDTIPLQRITLEDLVRFRTLAAFFHKGERVDGDIIPGGESHYYAAGRQVVSNLGSDAWLNVWSPAVADGQMSLSQLWVTSLDGDDKQTLEAGWQVMPDKWRTDRAALFIYHTTANYKSGTGCYNLDCTGFVQIANNVYLGSGFDHYSATDGTQWGFELQFKRGENGSWWLFYRGPDAWIPVGYYPKSLFGNGALSRQAERVTYGGEASGEPGAKQMGSGAKAEQNFGKAAFQNTLFYIDTHGTSQWADLFEIEPDPGCYTVEINNIFGAWGTYLYFGGLSCN